MKIESQVISLELAKRLKELGVKQNAYQAWVENKPDHSFHLWNEEMRAMRGQDLGIDRRKKEPEEYSAYSVAELGEMLPRVIELEGKPRWLTITNGQPTMERWYVSYDSVNTKPDYKLDTEADTEAESRGKMLVRLIQENLLTV